MRVPLVVLSKKMTVVQGSVLAVEGTWLISIFGALLRIVGQSVGGLGV